MSKLVTTSLLLSLACMAACSENNSKPTTDTESTVSALAGTLSLNLVPSLDAAAASSGSSLRLAAVGEAPDFKTMQADYLTPSAKQTLFGSSPQKQDYCSNVSNTARALSKFLSNDSNLCIFKEVENARKAAKSYITITKGTIGDEGLFGQISADKKIKIAASVGDGSMDIFFDIKGSQGSTTADYQLTMRQCQGGSLASVQVVTIERSTRKVSIRQNALEDGSPKEDLFSGYLNEEGTGWDLSTDRDFAYDMFRTDSTPNVYESVSTKFTKDGQILTTTVNGDQNRNIVAAKVIGSSANTLSLQEAYFKDLNNSNTSGMEFSTTGYVAADALDLKAIVDEMPTTGRFISAQTSVALPLIDEGDCNMDSPDIEGSLDLAAGQQEFDTICKNELTDSQDEQDAEGNPVLRSGAYCSSL